MNKKIFLISSVRGLDDSIEHFGDKYKREQEKKGNFVHFPLRDTNQVDLEGGINILNENREALKNSDVVAIDYNPASVGSVLDLGVAFIRNKEIKPVNNFDINKIVKDDFIGRFVASYIDSKYKKNFFYHNIKKVRENINYAIKKNSALVYQYVRDDIYNTFILGMAFGSDLQITTTNIGKVIIDPTKEKSIEHAIHSLEQKYQKPANDKYYLLPETIKKQ